MRLLRFFPSLTALAVRLAADGGPTIYWCDSEGGGSTLIVTPLGESVLIDSGNPGGRDSERIVHVIKDVAHLSRLDHLIVTHMHIDHFGGAAEIAQAIPVGNVWDNGIPDSDPDGNPGSGWALTSKPYREMKVGERHVVHAGMAIPFKDARGGLQLHCLAAKKEVWQSPGVHLKTPRQPTEKPVDTSDNANSSVWLLKFGRFSFYDGGDLTWNIETTLYWPTQWVDPVDIYQVTHHGLDQSNNPWLVRALRPTVSVMNNGPTKGTMGEVMTTLNSLPGLQAQYQMHKNLRLDGATNNCPDAQIANLEAKCSGNYMRCAVSARGSDYTIEIPATGYRRTFKSKG